MTKLTTKPITGTKVVLVIGIGFLLMRQLQKYYVQYKLYENGKQKKLKLRNKIHKCLENPLKIDYKIREEILSISATKIRELIIDTNNDINCETVMQIFIQKAYQNNKKLNYMLEEHYDTAMDIARNIDKRLNELKHNKIEYDKYVKSKPLLGIPISVKDVFEMKDSDCTSGTLYLCNKPVEKDGATIKIIKNMGGIPFCKTNTPQLNMLPECSNAIIGYTNNPYNLNISPGGSSGGEGAIIGSKGSILGIGTDIGGSIRIPAHYCGIIGYKPSSRRCITIGKRNVSGLYTNKPSIASSCGPMGRYVDDIVLFLKEIMWSKQAFELDCNLAQIPFRNNIYNDKKKLTIGYWFDDDWMFSTKPVARAIKKCINILENEYGYNVVKIPFKDGKKVLKLYIQYLGCEGDFVEFYRALKGEPLHKNFRILECLGHIPNRIRKILGPILSLFGEQRRRFMNGIGKKHGFSVKEYKDIAKKIHAYKYEFWDNIKQYSNNKIDLIITPVNFWPGLPHNYCADFIPLLTVTMLQNILDTASASFGPVTYVKQNELNIDLNELKPYYKDSLTRQLNKLMKQTKGLPVNVQIFGRMYDDEVVLRVMKELETSLNKKDNNE